MRIEVHIEWAGETDFVGRLHSAGHGPAVSFEYAPEWLGRADAFAIDPTALPLRPGPHHAARLFGAMQDCGPDRWGRVLIERAVRKHVLDRKSHQSSHPRRLLHCVRAPADRRSPEACAVRPAGGRRFMWEWPGALCAILPNSKSAPALAPLFILVPVGWSYLCGMFELSAWRRAGSKCAMNREPQRQ